jgi:hypothetical protein
VRSNVLFALLLLAACARQPDRVAEGRRLYLAYGCAACHGVDGEGNGPAAALSHFKPRDLRDLTRYSGPTSVEGLATTIAFGIADGRTGMPGYPDVPRHERENMARWIRSLGPRVTLRNAWIRRPAGTAVAAAYLDVRNGSSRAMEIVGASSPAAPFLEIHESVLTDGMMRMRKRERLALPPRQTVSLAPGGSHLMLINLRNELAVGDLVPLTIVLADGTRLTTNAAVRAE